MEITMYQSPKLTNKVLWYDVPGAGTLPVHRWDYFKNQCLYMFDAIILVWNDRLMDPDVEILSHCQKLEIPCFVVRARSDGELKDIRRDIRDELDLSSDDDDSDDQLSHVANSRFSKEVETFRRKNQEILDNTCRTLDILDELDLSDSDDEDIEFARRCKEEMDRLRSKTKCALGEVCRIQKLRSQKAYCVCAKAMYTVVTGKHTKEKLDEEELLADVKKLRGSYYH